MLTDIILYSLLTLAVFGAATAVLIGVKAFADWDAERIRKQVAAKYNN